MQRRRWRRIKPALSDGGQDQETGNKSRKWTPLFGANSKIMYAVRWIASRYIPLVFFIILVQVYQQRTLFWSLHGRDDHVSSSASSNSVAVASFREVAESSLPPPTIIDGVAFPRNIAQRLYMGTGLWNSRVSLPRALSAMFGDKSAYVETPAFTICRLQLQHGNDEDKLMAAMRQELFRTSDKRRDFLGYHRFFTGDFRRTVNCTTKDGTLLDEVAAAQSAQSIIDARFQNISQIESLVKQLGTDKFNGDTEQVDLMYTTIHASTASQYFGPSIVIMKPDNDKRGLDLGYYTAIGRSAEGKINSCKDVPPEGIDPILNDAGEIIFPGYKRPEDVIGFEIRREESNKDRVHVHDLPHFGVPSITHSFYKESLPDHGTAVFLLHFPPGTVHCVEPSNKNDVYGSFFECNSGGKPPTGDHCVMTNDGGNFTKPLKTSGLIFDEDFRGGCNSAERVLMNLSPEHQGLGNHSDFDHLHSQMFQNILSSVSTRLGKDIFVAHFNHSNEKVACRRVQTVKSDDHREVDPFHVGLDTQMGNCLARVPSQWNHGNMIWNASVITLTQSNPLEYDAFGQQTIKNSQLVKGAPNWSFVLGLREPMLSKYSCYGFKGSNCTVNIATDSISGRVGINCQLECTYSGAWLASLDAPSECNLLARDMLVPVVSFHGNSLLRQAEVDPLHLPD